MPSHPGRAITLTLQGTAAPCRHWQISILTSQQEKGSFTNYENLMLNIDNLKNINILLMKLSSFMISGLHDSYTDFFLTFLFCIGV